MIHFDDVVGNSALKSAGCQASSGAAHDGDAAAGLWGASWRLASHHEGVR